MVQETWTTVAIPLLERVLAGELSGSRAATTAVLEQSNIDGTTQRNLAALIEDDYLAGGSVHWPMGRGAATIVADVLRLTPKGRRAVGQWPSGQAGDVLIRALETTLLELPEGATKSRMRALLNAARDVGTEVLTGVVATVVKSTMGLP